MNNYSTELLKDQRKIETLSLVTDGACVTSQWTRHLVVLGGFKAVQSLSWKGLKRMEDFRSLSTCIRANAPRIENFSARSYRLVSGSGNLLLELVRGGRIIS